MCLRPFIGKPGIYYLYVKKIFNFLSDSEFLAQFSYADIIDSEFHRRYQDGEHIESHCFLGFESLEIAVQVKRKGPMNGWFYPMSIISEGVNIGCYHWKPIFLHNFIILFFQIFNGKQSRKKVQKYQNLVKNFYKYLAGELEKFTNYRDSCYTVW